ncbi:MAG: hypothetical protein KDK10_00965 [Maritimibacter sp.]|nr:hypothetical protein [Maritimibacter sp.]
MLIDDPAYQLVSRAGGYLRAAQIIVDSGNSNPEIVAPTMQLVAHGIEVLMKHVLIVAGYTVEMARKEYGHSLKRLWNAEEMADFRDISFEVAVDAWAVAATSGKYRDKFSENPRDLIRSSLEDLDRLHTSESNYSLRYVSAPDETAPAPMFLLDTFRPVEERLRSRYLLSERSRQYA